MNTITTVPENEIFGLGNLRSILNILSMKSSGAIIKWLEELGFKQQYKFK